MTALIQQLKDAGQDHEFYPTTNEILRKVTDDLDHHEYSVRRGSVLDIGAGNGKALLAFKAAGCGPLLAIEKSPILCRQLPDDVLIVGTVFEEQSLLSKTVEIIFSNPPYSVFEPWTEKIIREATCKVAYLVIPDRWSKSIRIRDALQYREAATTVLGNFDFEDAEDRQARAKVQLVKIKFDEANDAFASFFKDQFAELIAKFENVGTAADDETTWERKDSPFANLVVGQNYPEVLVELYQQEMAKIQRNYELVGQLDVALLKEFDISPKRILECLKTRLTGLRNLYWNELFSRLDSVTDRLTATSRKQVLETLHNHVQVDFTVGNILEVLVWLIRNANQFMDRQLIQTYELMVDKCNVQFYKSNQRTWVNEGWRYNVETTQNTHFALDYRVVCHHCGGVRDGGEWRYNRGLDESAAEFIGDLLTLANNLGFITDASERHCLSYATRKEQWSPGVPVTFTHRTEDRGRQVLLEVRGFKNGNLHLRFAKEFILALNVEHGRLKGWLRSPAEAVHEMQDTKAARYFGANRQITAPDPRPLLGA